MAIDQGCDVAMCYGRDDARALATAVLNRNFSVQDAIGSIDAASAGAMMASDKQMILRMIQKTCGLKQFNEQLQGYLQNAIQRAVATVMARAHVGGRRDRPAVGIFATPSPPAGEGRHVVPLAGESLTASPRRKSVVGAQEQASAQSLLVSPQVTALSESMSSRMSALENQVGSRMAALESQVGSQITVIGAQINAMRDQMTSQMNAVGSQMNGVGSRVGGIEEQMVTMVRMMREINNLFSPSDSDEGRLPPASLTELRQIL